MKIYNFIHNAILTLGLFAVVSSSIDAFAQTSLPQKAMGKPVVFQHEQDSWNWNNVAAKREWGKLSNEFWVVYIDREGAKSYESPSYNSGVEKNSLDFMQPYYVAKTQDGFALLYEEKDQQTNLEISRKAKSIGWVPIDHLLLWSSCPRTIGQVYQKAVILKDIDAIQNKKDINETSPEFSKAPDRTVGAGWRATDLEFYFVYKTVNGSALLFADSKLPQMGDIAKEKKGWMKRGLYTTWNERLCYEPNFGDEALGRHAAIFKTKESARQYKQNGDYESNNPLWVEKIKKKRWAPSQVRFPVLEVSGDYIAQVGTIGALGDGSAVPSNSNAGEITNLKKKIDEIERKMDRVNVVFVMDGTSSMKNYYQPMAQALKEAMNQNSMKGANMYFGAVIYRNYADGDRLTEMKQLTQDYQGISNWLASRECKSIGESHYEALYYGLDYAISNMNWNKDNCNFLVLVGDAANAANDSRGKNMNSIVSKMAAYGVNFVAFQANHLNHAAYHEFAVQIQQIMTKELSQLMGRSVRRGDFKLSNQLYQVRSTSDEWPIYSSAYRFAQIDKSENANELERVVEQKIVDFKEQANTQLVMLRQAIENLGGTAGGNMGTIIIDPKRIEDMLMQIGLTKSDIALLKEANTTLKVKGFATRNANGVDVFTPSVFMAKAELDDLIASLERVSQNISTNRRQDLQNALKSLALSYIGQGKDVNELNVDDVMDAVSGLTSGTGKNVLAGVNIKDLTNPNKVTDNQISDFVDQIRQDVSFLKKKRNDKSCYFDSKNHVRYYYILLEDMPLQNHNDAD